MVLITKCDDTLFLQHGKNKDNLVKKTELLPYEENKFWLDNKKVRLELATNPVAKEQTLIVYYNGTSDCQK
jgi:hypothetical protein